MKKTITILAILIFIGTALIAQPRYSITYPSPQVFCTVVPQNVNLPMTYTSTPSNVAFSVLGGPSTMSHPYIVTLNGNPVTLTSPTSPYMEPISETMASFTINPGDTIKVQLQYGSPVYTTNLIIGTASTSGISHFDQINSNIKLYPNPTSDQFYIETSATDKLNVDLFDVNGRHVFSANVNDKENINVTTLDNGAYTLTIKTADRIINKKLVILR